MCVFFNFVSCGFPRYLCFFRASPIDVFILVFGPIMRPRIFPELRFLILLYGGGGLLIAMSMFLCRVCGRMHTFAQLTNRRFCVVILPYVSNFGRISSFFANAIPV